MTEVGTSVVDPAQFRSLMATFPAGVAIVTTTEESGTTRGMTCSSVSSVSLRPPILLVCLREGSPTLDTLLASSRFAVNLLHSGGRTAADVFASPATDRFDKVHWQWCPTFGGPHLVDDAHTIADCRVAGTNVVGDHTVVFGEVFNVRRPISEPPDPLVYGLRGYWSLGAGRDGTAPGA